MTSPQEPFNNTIPWIWSHEGLVRPRPAEDRASFRTRYFRRTFDAPAGARLLVHVSADSEYRLWCNGTEVSFGPAKGDIEHQFYDTLDLTAHLRAGSNVLAVHAVYYGDVWADTVGGGPIYRMTAVPGFILWGRLEDAAGAELATVHSDARWRVWVDTAYQQIDNKVAWWLASTEEFNCSRFPWGFTEPGFDDSGWAFATPTVNGISPSHVLFRLSPHCLVPRMTATLELSEPLKFARVCRGGTEAQRAALGQLLAQGGSLRFEPNTTTTLLIAAPAETTGFPRIEFSGGAGGSIKLTYAESLWTADGRKENREDMSGKMIGYYDVILPDGPARAWQPFAFRTFRYVELEVCVKDQPLVLGKLDYRFTAYPFKEQARFESSDPAHASVWEICWRTARLCAHETYEDCPYYEQLQYGGDTQVQAMISYYVAGDASLARQWLYQFDGSRTPDGLTRSRYPARVPQTIPFWSLHWVMAVWDYWQHTGDIGSVKELLPGVLAVMGYFERRRSADGLVGKLHGWQCADWCPQWTKTIDGTGVPPGTLAGHSAFVNLMTAVTLEHAAELAAVGGRDGAELTRNAQAIKRAVHEKFYDEKRGMYWDTPARNIASAYTNVWGLLGNMPCDHAKLADSVVSDKSLCQLTPFSNYFAYRALAKVGRYDLAPKLLAPWREMLAMGLSTCPEIPDFTATRSDCHAWSAGPLVEFCREILGVRPAKPGYAAILIAPKPAGLTHARGRVPLTRLTGDAPLQCVSVDWALAGNRFKLRASAPAGIPCEILLPGGERQTFPQGGDCVLEGGK